RRLKGLPAPLKSLVESAILAVKACEARHAWVQSRKCCLVRLGETLLELPDLHHPYRCLRSGGCRILELGASILLRASREARSHVKDLRAIESDLNIQRT